MRREKTSLQRSSRKRLGRRKAMKLLLPGIFLFLLGVGNIGVGQFKGLQYQQVLQELAALEPTPGLENASTLRRVQYAEEVASRHYERRTKARARLDFYELVVYGGKVFVGISFVILAGGILRYIVTTRSVPERTLSDFSGADQHRLAAIQ